MIKENNFTDFGYWRAHQIYVDAIRLGRNRSSQNSAVDDLHCSFNPFGFGLLSSSEISLLDSRTNRFRQWRPANNNSPVSFEISFGCVWMGPPRSTRKKILNIALKSTLEINLLHFGCIVSNLFSVRALFATNSSVSMQAPAAQVPMIPQSRRPFWVCGATNYEHANTRQKAIPKECPLLLLPST